MSTLTETMSSSKPEKPQRKKVKLEQLFLDAWNANKLRGIELVQQHYFHPTRRFRLDFAIVALKIGIEVDGFFMRHNTNWGISESYERQNLAIELGWVIVRHTRRTLGSKKLRADAIDQLWRIIEMRRKQFELYPPIIPR